MRYAMIENGVVTNVIIGLPNGVSGVVLGDRPVSIGDAYRGETFYRDEAPVLTELEKALEEIKDMKAALAILGVTENG